MDWSFSICFRTTNQTAEKISFWLRTKTQSKLWSIKYLNAIKMILRVLGENTSWCLFSVRCCLSEATSIQKGRLLQLILNCSGCHGRWNHEWSFFFFWILSVLDISILFWKFLYYRPVFYALFKNSMKVFFCFCFYNLNLTFKFVKVIHGYNEMFTW